MSETFTRPDGRGLKELRKLEIEVGILDRADGSSRVHLGRNIAVATVFGPREMHPKHAARSDRAVMRINYRMATFSVDDYKRPFPSRREKEISKVLSEAFDSVVLTENWPRSVIDVHVELFQSDGGTRTAAAIAITAALADAGLPMRDLTGGIASGLYEDHVCLDLTGHEDMKGDGDMPILYSPNLDEISLFQLDGKFTFSQFKEAFTMSMDGIREIVDEIKNSLKSKYLKVREEYGVDDDDSEVDAHMDDDHEEDIDLDDGEEIEIEEIDLSQSSFVAATVKPVGAVEEKDEEATEQIQEETPVESSTSEATSEDNETQAMEEEAPVTSASSTDMGMETSSHEESPSSEIETEQTKEDLISSTWFTRPGGQIKPMEANKVAEEDEDESESVLRDIEYSLEEDE